MRTISEQPDLAIRADFVSALSSATLGLDNTALLGIARQISLHYGLDPIAVAQVLTTLRDCFLDLARDPVGLTALAEMVAVRLGAASDEPFMVTVH